MAAPTPSIPVTAATVDLQRCASPKTVTARRTVAANTCGGKKRGATPAAFGFQVKQLTSTYSTTLKEILR